MKYKKRHLLLAGIIALPLLFGRFTYRKSGGSHPGSTGAPPENSTCSQPNCHSPALVSYNDTTVNKLIFPISNNTYIPGVTYKITLQVKNPGISRFGFEILALQYSSNTNIGEFSIIDSNRTHLIARSIGTDDRTSVTHSIDGTPAITLGFNEWSFNWTAPSTNGGDIIFYYATNSTNNNNNELGDAIYVSTFIIEPDLSNSIAKYMDDKNIIAFFDTKTEQFKISYTLKSDENVTINISDNLGRTLFQENSASKTKGIQNDKIAIGKKISKGLYFINLMVANTKISKKVIVN